MAVYRSFLFTGFLSAMLVSGALINGAVAGILDDILSAVTGGQSLEVVTEQYLNSVDDTDSDGIEELVETALQLIEAALIAGASEDQLESMGVAIGAKAMALSETNPSAASALSGAVTVIGVNAVSTGFSQGGAFIPQMTLADGGDDTTADGEDDTTDQTDNTITAANTGEDTGDESDASGGNDCTLSCN